MHEMSHHFYDHSIDVREVRSFGTGRHMPMVCFKGSSSSSSTKNITETTDNRQAATGEGIVQRGSGSIDVERLDDDVLRDVLSAGRALFGEAGDLGARALSTNERVSRDALGANAQVSQKALRANEDVSKAALQSQLESSENAFDFSEDVADGAFELVEESDAKTTEIQTEVAKSLTDQQRQNLNFLEEVQQDFTENLVENRTSPEKKEIENQKEITKIVAVAATASFVAWIVIPNNQKK